MELKEIAYKEFVIDIYNYYVELFAENERQPLKILKSYLKMVI